MTTTKPQSTTETLEPSLEDLAIEAAALLDSLPTYVSDQTIRHAQQMAFALRACIQNTRARPSPASAAPVVDTDVIDVLDGIKGFYGTNDCWCDSEGDAAHFGHCIKARALYERLKQTPAAATAAPAEQSDSLLTKIAHICDLGSAAEFGDAVERLRAIRDLVLNSQLTEEESQLIIGAIPLQALPEERQRAKCVNCAESILRTEKGWEHEYPYRPECLDAVPAYGDEGAR